MNILFLGTYADKPYLPHLKSMFGTASVFILTDPITTVIEVTMYCAKRNITGVVSTNTTLLSKLLGKDGDRKVPSLDAYAGSLFKKGELQIVFINPLEHFNTVSYSKFLARKYISKLTAPESWFPAINFTWEILNESNADRIFDSYSSATIIAVDIETLKDPLSIRCIGYTAIFIHDNIISSHSCVLAVDSPYAVSIMRKFNWQLTAPKVFQNGKYDLSYLARYNASVYNWQFDTATMFHCWYSELPKDLGFLGAFFVREAMYWKDLADTTDLHEYYLYNCRDHWTTAIVALVWMLNAPEWAKENYLKEFPLNFPCHLSEMTGIKRDMEVMRVARLELDERLARLQTSLDTMMGWNVNVNSPPQMKKVCKILGLGDVESTKESYLNKFMFQHPLNARILGTVLEIRGERKLKSTYLRTDDDITKTSPGGSKEFGGRILYSLIPHGTDTGRLASREHHFWSGLQIQNIPRDSSVKRTIVSDEGFLFGEVDLEQAESRDTAYISGDSTLISAVSGDNDFHSVTASAISGKTYESLYDNLSKKSLDKEVRFLLGKKMNHACSYNMGDNTMVLTLGPKNMEDMRRLLHLPKMMTYKAIAAQSIEKFHSKYTGLRAVMYPGIFSEVLTTSMLVGPTGWVRYCFGKPTVENKLVRNAYIAHMPQSCNAMGLNKAYMRVFYEIAMHPVHKDNFKLCAQIHDSILAQFRIGHEYLMEMVRKIMEEESTFTYKGYDGTVRTWTVPAAIKAGADGKGAKYWSETE